MKLETISYPFNVLDPSVVVAYFLKLPPFKNVVNLSIFNTDFY